jgi:fumarylpyruvate hydrolase
MNQTRRGFIAKSVATSVVAGSSIVAGCATTSATTSTSSTSELMFTPTMVTIPIVGSNQQFPVRRIYCVGRNYAAHAREMGSDPTREPPFFFQKPTDAIQLVPPGATIDHPYPPLTKNYHYEIELVAAIGKGGRNIKAENALDHVFAYAAGLDMTRRDLQRMMGDQKKPWEIGKSFDKSAVISHLHLASKVGHIGKGSITLKVNGTIKQTSDLSNMIWSVSEQIANLSTYYELFPGDIIYSGTPENVGPVVVGDVMEGHIDGLYDIRAKVV